MCYTYDVSDAVLSTFAGASKRHREYLLRVFDQLIEDPFLAGDFVERDAIGRPVQVKRFGDWCITYWSEHLADKVHVIDIEYLKG